MLLSTKKIFHCGILRVSQLKIYDRRVQAANQTFDVKHNGTETRYQTCLLAKEYGDALLSNVLFFRHLSFVICLTSVINICVTNKIIRCVYSYILTCVSINRLH